MNIKQINEYEDKAILKLLFFLIKETDRDLILISFTLFAKGQFIFCSKNGILMSNIQWKVKFY